MKKKILVAATLAGIVGGHTLAVAPHTGFSVGANLGVTDVDGKLNRTFSTPATDSSNLGARSPIVGLFLGYGWSPNSYGIYLGGEIFGQYENARASREDVTPVLGWKTRLETNNAFGAVAKLLAVSLIRLGTNRMVLCVEILWFETVPPQTFAVRILHQRMHDTLGMHDDIDFGFGQGK